MMQRSAAGIIRLFYADARLVHEQSDQSDHAVLTGHVNRKPSFTLVDNCPKWVKFCDTSHGGIFVESSDGVTESTSRISWRWCHCLAQLVKLIGCPLKHT